MSMKVTRWRPVMLKTLPLIRERMQLMIRLQKSLRHKEGKPPNETSIHAPEWGTPVVLCMNPDSHPKGLATRNPAEHEGRAKNNACDPAFQHQLLLPFLVVAGSHRPATDSHH